MSALGSFSPPGRAPRSAPLAMIHVGRKQLGLDDDAYRGLLEGVTGKRSAKDLTEQERHAVVARMRDLGFQPASKTHRRGLDGPYAAKLQALWIAGWNLGVVRDRRDKALVRFVERQTGLSHTRFLRFPEDAAKAIEGLKAWLAREGQVDWSAPPRGAPIHLGDDRYRIVRAQLRLLRDAGEALPAGPMPASAAEWIAQMNDLGVRVRALPAGAGKG